MKLNTISVGVIGASGYTGSELLRLLNMHPFLKVKTATAYNEANKPVDTVHPHLGVYSELTLHNHTESLSELLKCDLVFSALPHGSFMEIAPKFFNSLKVPKIIDLSSDFRLLNPESFFYWYNQQHLCPELLNSWQYGLSEIFFEKIRHSKMVANPGCFATAVILAFAPVVKAGITQGTLVVDAMSGTSGAGKKNSDILNFSHEHENIITYKIGEHQHIGEIEQTLNNLITDSASKNLKESNCRISMSTHLVPMTRGIYAICSTDLKSSKLENIRNVVSLYRDFYSNKPFVKVLEHSPNSKYVRGSNNVWLYPKVDERNNRIIIAVTLDNLVKGASGQAIQNANIMYEFPEEVGLPQVGLYP